MNICNCVNTSIFERSCLNHTLQTEWRIFLLFTFWSNPWSTYPVFTLVKLSLTAHSNFYHSVAENMFFCNHCVYPEISWESLVKITNTFFLVSYFILWQWREDSLICSVRFIANVTSNYLMYSCKPLIIVRNTYQDMNPKRDH